MTMDERDYDLLSDEEALAKFKDVYFPNREVDETSIGGSIAGQLYVRLKRRLQEDKTPPTALPQPEQPKPAPGEVVWSADDKVLVRAWELIKSRKACLSVKLIYEVQLEPHLVAPRGQAANPSDALKSLITKELRDR